MSRRYKTDCPACGERLEIFDAEVGEKCQCPQCEESFEVTADILRFKTARVAAGRAPRHVALRLLRPHLPSHTRATPLPTVSRQECY